MDPTGQIGHRDAQSNTEQKRTPDFPQRQQQDLASTALTRQRKHNGQQETKHDQAPCVVDRDYSEQRTRESAFRLRFMNDIGHRGRSGGSGNARKQQRNLHAETK